MEKPIRKCAICGDVIPDDWDTVPELQLCQNKSCWVIYLPEPFRSKYFPLLKDRFEMLRDE